MRDIVKVIDAVLREIPDSGKWLSLRGFLEYCRKHEAYRAPESTDTWECISKELSRELPWPPVEPWQQRVADIWSGRTEIGDAS